MKQGVGPKAPTRLERLAYAVAIYGAFFLFYGACNRLIPTSWCWDLTTALDRAIPFVPAFVFPFYLTYGLILLPALVLRDRASLIRSALAFVVLIVVSCLLFVAFPVRVPRPVHIPDSLAGNLLALIYASDRPVCGFPSLHVSTAVLATAVLFREDKRWGWVFTPLAVATSVATLFVRQHVLADVIGGVVLALVVDAGINRSLIQGLCRTHPFARLLTKSSSTKNSPAERAKSSDTYQK